MKIKFTRKQYMSGECTHKEYYSQMVTETIKRNVAMYFGVTKLKKHFKANDMFHADHIGIKEWDRISGFYVSNTPFYDLGDAPSLAGRNCVLKEAARQAIK